MSQYKNALIKLQKNWFILSLLFVILLSMYYPVVGYTIGFDGITKDTLITAIFLITGLTLPSETIVKKLKNIRFHVLMQSFIFIGIPLYVALTAPLLKPLISEWLLIGLYAVSVLPTTISSNVVFTQASGGNVVSTAFNAAFANILGILISPLLLSLLLRTSGQIMPLQELLGILYSLAVFMFLPIAGGQIIRQFIKRHMQKYGRFLRKSTSFFIIIIVLVTISTAVYNGVFNLSESGLYIVLLYLAASHLIFLMIMHLLTGFFKFDWEDRISALYIGTQKTIAMGAPLLTIFFANKPELIAASIVPLSFYHLWQLTVAGFIRSAAIKNKKHG